MPKSAKMTNNKKKKTKRSPFDSVADLEEQDATAAKLRRKQSTKDVAQAKAARSQTKIYSKLMETRILLQRGLQAAVSSEINNEDDSQEACNQLLEQLLMARRKLMPADNEPSDKDNDDNSLFQSEYEICQQEWKDVLNRRHQGLRLHAGLASKSNNQFKVLDSSFWHQVESTVAHEEMHRRHKTTTTTDDDLFEDAKIYQHMLKDFLVTAAGASNTNNGNENAALASNKKSNKQQQQQQQQQVDRKASKGRKIRYVEIPKLANFTFPVSRRKVTNLDEDEWFQSLFGGQHGGNNKRGAGTTSVIADVEGDESA